MKLEDLGALRVHKDLHRKVKIAALKNNMSMCEVSTQALKKWLKENK